MAKRAVSLSFALNGFAFASWVSRVPEVRGRLGLSNGELGLLLICMSVASVTGLPSAGPLVQRFGAANVVRAGTVLVGAGLAAVATGVLNGSLVITGLGLALNGLGSAVWDVAMNVEGASVERALRRTVMPHFHALFSIGTVVGALTGALVIRLGVPLGFHLGVVAALVVACSIWATGSFLVADEQAAGRPAWHSWLEPRTLVVGVMVLALALTEGSANDWLALALKDGYAAPNWLAVLGFAGFVSAMTLGRLVGTRLLDRFGRLPVLYSTIAMALAGLLLLVFGGPVLAVPAILMWGLGASLGFPVGMSAAADDPVHAAARVSVVSTIGYVAFLAGPPLLGFVGDRVGTLRALLVVAIVLVPSLLAVPAAREGVRASLGGCAGVVEFPGVEFPG